MKGLRVAGRTSSFHFKGKNEDLRAIGEALAVGHVLGGSVRKSGNRVRITAQLINAASGYHLWTESYEREIADVFAIQDEIAKAVTSALEVTLGVGAFGHVQGMTHNATAFDEYLKGKAAFGRFDHDSRIQAVEHYQRAIALDPTFTPAMVNLWYAYSYGGTLVPEKIDEWRRKAADVLARASKATPTSPYVLEILAADKWQKGDWCAAATALDRLPSFAAEFGTQSRVDLAIGSFLMRVGRLRDAVAKLEVARASNRRNARNKTQLVLGWALRCSRPRFLARSGHFSQRHDVRPDLLLMASIDARRAAPARLQGARRRNGSG